MKLRNCAGWDDIYGACWRTTRSAGGRCPAHRETPPRVPTVRVQLTLPARIAGTAEDIRRALARYEEIHDDNGN